MTLDAVPTSALEDWRYVDCKPLGAGPPAAGRLELGAAASAGDLPAASDAAHAWALRGTLRRLDLRGEQRLDLDDAGGAWALRLDLAPGAVVRLRLRRHAAGAGWLHAVLGRGAALEIDDLPGSAGVQLAAISATVAQDARLALRIAQAGGALVRHRVDISLDQPGASCAVHAATALRGSDQAHILTRVVHAAAATRSDQLLKAVLRDAARSSFDGVVSMRKGADGSTATQQDRNLLLSPAARADTRPQLDIRADEVEASHGATVGELDPEELIYLRARGLDAGAARDLLTVAFLDEVLLGFAEPSLRTRLHAASSLQPPASSHA